MTSSVPKFTVWEQRVALTDLADQRSEFLATAAGAAFLEQLDLHIAPKLVGIARDPGGEWGYHLERDDVVHMIIVHLLTSLEENPDKAPVRYAAEAEDPWGYLWTCGRRWILAERGVRGRSLEFAELLPAPDVDDADHGLTPLDEVVRLTYEQLVPRIPKQYQAEVLSLLGWIAANPPQRLSYEGAEQADAHRYCPGLTLGQVVAVFNIARGGRPRNAETSLMGQYLLDAGFQPSSSPSHMRALIFFKNAFRAAEKGSRMLTDWN
ncbi:hypothetical protein D3248_01630 [Leucobacter zeae]|nr:hypothetical protein [Leucobacter zeae]